MIRSASGNVMTDMGSSRDGMVRFSCCTSGRQALPPARNRGVPLDARPQGPIGHRRRRPLPRRRLQCGRRHVVAVRRRHLLRAAAHPVGCRRQGPRRRDRPVRGPLLHRAGQIARAGRARARHRPVRLAQPRGAGPLRRQLRQARRARRRPHDLEGRQPRHAAGRAAGQARRRAPALHPHRRRAFAGRCSPATSSSPPQSCTTPASSCSTTCCTPATRR